MWQEVSAIFRSAAGPEGHLASMEGENVDERRGSDRCSNQVSVDTEAMATAPTLDLRLLEDLVIPGSVCGQLGAHPSGVRVPDLSRTQVPELDDKKIGRTGDEGDLVPDGDHRNSSQRWPWNGLPDARAVQIAASSVGRMRRFDPGGQIID